MKCMIWRLRYPYMVYFEVRWIFMYCSIWGYILCMNGYESFNVSCIKCIKTYTSAYNIIWRNLIRDSKIPSAPLYRKLHTLVSLSTRRPMYCKFRRHFELDVFLATDLRSINVYQSKGRLSYFSIMLSSQYSFFRYVC